MTASGMRERSFSFDTVRRGSLPATAAGYSLEGKTLPITGAARGIGAEAARPSGAGGTANARR